MEQATVAIIMATLAILFSIAAVLIANKKQTILPANDESSLGSGTDTNYTARPLQLQAYERLVMLTERIALPNMIGRLNQAGISSNDMRAILSENIKQEYEYNASQQIYVSQQAWEAVRNFKDQNITLVNRVASSLPQEASGIDLNKKILETLMNQKLGDIHNVILEALNLEAKKLMR